MSKIVSFFTPEIISLIIFFLITVLNQQVATLRSIFVAHKAGFATYVTVAIEAVLYTLIVKSLAEQTYLTIILYVVGKLLGTYLANVIEDKLALGIYDVEIYIKDHEKQKLLQDKLLEKGFSSTMNVGTLSETEVRWWNTVHLKRRDMKTLYEILEELDITRPTMVIKQVNSVTGRIEDRI